MSAKTKSKCELYKLLSMEGNIYLPPEQDAIRSYLKKLMLGDKLYVKWSEVVVIKVLLYRGLKVRNLIRFDESNLNITIFLPEYSCNKELIENGCEMLSIYWF